MRFTRFLAVPAMAMAIAGSSITLTGASSGPSAPARPAKYVPPYAAYHWGTKQGHAHLLNLLHGDVRPGTRLDVEGHPVEGNLIGICQGCTDTSFWSIIRVRRFAVGPGHQVFLSSYINQQDRGGWIMQIYYEGKGHRSRHPMCAAMRPRHSHQVVIEPCNASTRWVMYPDTSAGNDPWVPEVVSAYISIAATNALSGRHGRTQYVLYALDKQGNKASIVRLMYQTGDIIGAEDWEICTYLSGGRCWPYPNGR